MQVSMSLQVRGAGTAGKAGRGEVQGSLSLKVRGWGEGTWRGFRGTPMYLTL